jgi:hypothetical protein
MKKIEYKTPEMEVFEVKMECALLAESYNTEPDYGGAGEPGVNDPD